MIPADLNIEEFAKNMTQQASQSFPAEISKEARRNTLQYIGEFIKSTGNSLKKSEENYNIDEAVFICQMVGEWVYYKSIENYQNQIPQEYHKPILSQLTLTIYETVTTASVDIMNNQAVILDRVQSVIDNNYDNYVREIAGGNVLKSKETGYVEEITGGNIPQPKKTYKNDYQELVNVINLLPQEGQTVFKIFICIICCFIMYHFIVFEMFIIKNGIFGAISTATDLPGKIFMFVVVLFMVSIPIIAVAYCIRACIQMFKGNKQ